MNRSVTERVRSGVELFEAGKTSEAFGVLQGVLAEEPEHPIALRVLAQMALNNGQTQLALEHLNRVLDRDPENADVVHEIAEVYRESGELQRAVDHTRQAIDLRPDSAEMYNNLGGLFEQLGDVEAAIDAYQDATQRAPAQAIPFLNLGLLLRTEQKIDRAVDCFRTASTLDPYLSQGWFSLGETLLVEGRAAESLGPLRRACELSPNSAAGYLCLADALQLTGSREQAVEAYRRGLATEPEHAEAWYGLGHVQLELEEPAAAVASLEQCIKRSPNNLKARLDLGRALFDLGCIDDAIKHLRIVTEQGADAVKMQALRNLAVIGPGSPKEDHSTVLADRSAWAAANLGTAEPRRPAAREFDSTRKLEIGYVCSFFYRANFMKPVWALVNHHNRDRFGLHFFCDVGHPGFEPPGYRKQPQDQFHNVAGMSPVQLSDSIREAGVDILVDLNGYSHPQSFLAYMRRPSPIIISWFAMYGTTGVECIDYIVGDRHVVEESEEGYFSERVLRVDGSYMTFILEHPAPEIVSPPCLQSDRFTFGCLAPLYKIDDSALEAWGQILSQAPRADLILKNTGLGSQHNREHLLRRMGRYGIDSKRVTLEGPADHFEFLRTYDRIDVGLDSFPYNGGTTTAEAIWQGVPLLSFYGDRWVSRISASILRTAGLGEFVSAARRSYVEQAVDLANDSETPAMLEKLRREMRDRLRVSTAMDAPAFAKSMESLYCDAAARPLGAQS